MSQYVQYVFESAVDASDAAIIDLMFTELEDIDNIDGKG